MSFSKNSKILPQNVWPINQLEIEQKYKYASCKFNIEEICGE